MNARTGRSTGEEDKGKQQGGGNRPETREEKERLKKEAEKMFIKELRLRVEEYFRVVITTLREIIPKNVGYFLVR